MLDRARRESRGKGSDARLRRDVSGALASRRSGYFALNLSPIYLPGATPTIFRNIVTNPLALS